MINCENTEFDIRPDTIECRKSGPSLIMMISLQQIEETKPETKKERREKKKARKKDQVRIIVDNLRLSTFV